jgi:hypothetical protein
MFDVPKFAFGPCERDCHHVDCVETRRQAASLCRFCGEPIGYLNAYAQDPVRDFAGPARLVHDRCLKTIPRTPWCVAI